MVYSDLESPRAMLCRRHTDGIGDKMLAVPLSAPLEAVRKDAQLSPSRVFPQSASRLKRHLFWSWAKATKKHGKKVVKKGGMCGRVKQRGKAVTESDGSKTRGKTDTLLSLRARALYPEGIIFRLSISPWDLSKSKGQQGLARGRESCSAFVHVNSRLMTPSGC